jgi:hypothetical protein
MRVIQSATKHPVAVLRRVSLGGTLAAAVGAGLALLVVGSLDVAALYTRGVSELGLPLSQDGQYTLVIGIAERYCPYNSYQTYGASGCAANYRWNCNGACLYAGYRTPSTEHELMLGMPTGLRR